MVALFRPELRQVADGLVAFRPIPTYTSLNLPQANPATRNN